MDIVKRLRGEYGLPQQIKTTPICQDAADEIERLREALLKLDRVAKDSYGSPAYGSMASSFVQSIVSKALGEKE